MKPIGSYQLFVRDDGPGAVAAHAGPELTARHARAGSASARKRTLAVLTAAAALSLGMAQPAAAGTLTPGTSGLFLPSDLFIPVDPCLVPGLV
jgi:hypothetical protein